MAIKSVQASSFDPFMASKIGEQRAKSLEETFRNINNLNSDLFQKFRIQPMNAETHQRISTSTKALIEFTQKPDAFILKVPSPPTIYAEEELDSFLQENSESVGTLTVLPVKGKMKYKVRFDGALLGEGTAPPEACKKSLSYLRGLISYPVWAFTNLVNRYGLEITQEELSRHIAYSDETKPIFSIVLEYLDAIKIGKRAEKIARVYARFPKIFPPIQ